MNRYMATMFPGVAETPSVVPWLRVLQCATRTQMDSTVWLSRLRCSHTLHRCKNWLDVLLRNRKSSMETGGARARVFMNMRRMGLALAVGDPSRLSAPTILRSYLSIYLAGPPT